MSIDGTLSGAGSGTASAVVASFDKPAVRWLSLDLARHRSARLASRGTDGRPDVERASSRPTRRWTAWPAASRGEPRAGPARCGRIPARQATAQVEIDARS